GASRRAALPRPVRIKGKSVAVAHAAGRPHLRSLRRSTGPDDVPGVALVVAIRVAGLGVAREAVQRPALVRPLPAAVLARHEREFAQVLLVSGDGSRRPGGCAHAAASG